MDKFNYRAIGIIHSPFKSREGTPIQPIGAIGVKAEVEIFPEYVEGLQDLEEFSHIILLYHCHLSQAYKLTVKPFLLMVYYRAKQLNLFIPIAAIVLTKVNSTG